VPVVLNTSFNENESVVGKLKEALLTRVEPVCSIFYTVIDVLDQLVLKRDGVFHQSA
jgi:hypothetical protein